MKANYVVHFEIVDAAGAVVSHGSCWSGDLGDLEVGEGQIVRILDDKGAPSRKETVYGYGLVRKQEYPGLDEQIGVLWKVIANLPAKYLTDEAKEMMQRIADVKDQYEKGAEFVLNDGTDPSVRSRFKKA